MAGSNDRIYIRDTARESDEVATLSARYANLADRRLGATVTAVSDAFYGGADRILNPQPAHFYFHDEEGMRWVDGWETTRRRRPGHEHCVIRLGKPGRLRGVAFDTAFFTGNFPVGVELDGYAGEGDPGEAAQWVPLVRFTKLSGNSQTVAMVDDGRRYTHVRLNLHPDGGLARLRVYGDIDVPAFGGADVQIDLAALENGGRTLGCSDRHFGDLNALIAPGPSIEWGKGWETRRRREPGNDWAVIALAGAGCIDEVEIDTTYYLANQPERFSLQAAFVEGAPDDAVVLNQSMFWRTLLGEHRLQGGDKQRIAIDGRAFGPVTHVRLSIFPDGGVTRLRLRGCLSFSTPSVIPSC